MIMRTKVLMMSDAYAYFSLRMRAEREIISATGTSHEKKARPRNVRVMPTALSQNLFLAKESPTLC